MFYSRRRKLILPSRFRQCGIIMLAAAGTMAATEEELVQFVADNNEFHKTSPTSACYAGINLTAVGQTRAIGPGSATRTLLADWMLQGVAADYWVYCNVTAGSLYSSSATGSWITMDSNNLWQVRDSDDSGAGEAATFTLSISTDSSGTPVIASQEYTPFANWIDEP